MLLGGDELPPHPARQQQRLLPGQRDELVRLVAARGAAGTLPLYAGDDRLPSGASRARQERFYTDADIHWFGPRGVSPDWMDPQARELGCRIQQDGPGDLCLLFNAGSGAVDFCLPPLAYGARWHVAVDTALAATRDGCAEGEEPPVLDPQSFRLEGYASAALLARPLRQIY